MNIINKLILSYLSRYKLILIAVFVTAVLLTACNNKVIDPPPDEEPLPKLTIINEDVSCTEVWLKIKVDSLNTPSDIKLYRDSSLILNLSASGGLNLDTLYYEENLLPNRSYVYKLILTYNNKEYTESVNVTTLNITSSNFTWETIEFGQHSSSVLYDVAIVGEQIWAVGEIYMNDAQGNPDPKLYNAVHWDGEKWEVKRVLFPTVCTGSSFTSYPAKSIFAFNNGEIWISSSGDKIAILKNGIQINQFCIPSLLSMSINKMWGTSSSDLYIVGNNGNIAHYNGSSWRKIEIPVGIGFEELAISDILGREREGMEPEVIITAHRYPFSMKFYVCKIEDNKVVPLYLGDIENEKPKHSVWFISGRKYYIAGGGVDSKININDEENWKEERSFLPYFLTSIRGSSYNNIFVGGSFGVLYHYNGVKWNLLMANSGMTNGNVTGISVNMNISVLCGSSNNKAVITTIKN